MSASIAVVTGAGRGIGLAIAKALAAQPDAQKRFDALAYSIRKEHARSVASAKKPETRDRRVATIIAALTDNG